MSVTVRLLEPHELRLYLEIIGRAIRGIPEGHYSAEAIEGWVPPDTDDTLRELAVNADGEIRLIAESDGVPIGIGALVTQTSELRACYVVPEAAHRGCGAAIVRQIERLAEQHGLQRLHLAASLNAEAFYTSLGYTIRERGQVALPNGHILACIWMEKAFPRSSSTRP